MILYVTYYYTLYAIIVTSALEFSLLRLKRIDYYKDFFIVDLIVILSRVEFLAYKNNRV